MLPVSMLNNINMELFQALNPLYAVPIVAVILCAFLVYAFGFKSPVPPPSFEGIEEEKKYPKKRKAKDSQKGNKLLQNGKINGSAVAKNNAPSKKKESAEKHVLEKSVSSEKTIVDKKAAKKSRLQNEKKLPQEKKKESLPQEDLSGEGWVQLVSKKGRKNRKKDDSTTEIPPNVAKVVKAAEINKSDDSSQIEESPKKSVELLNDGLPVEQIQAISASVKEVSTKDKSLILNAEKSKLQDLAFEETKPEGNIEKLQSKEVAAKGTKVLEETSKSKKKKKKGLELVPPENVVPANITSTISQVQEVKEVSAPKISPTNINPKIVADIPPVSSDELNQSIEAKASNVAFDELAGLYPAAKEQKKKKKVRRDH